MYRFIIDKVAFAKNGCWIWKGVLTKDGYGKHRKVYTSLVGPIPKDKVLDHLCDRRDCVNPDHFQVITQRENVMKAQTSLGYNNFMKTHCINGHEFTKENTYVRPGKKFQRHCKTCRRENSLRFRGALA